MVQIEKSQCPLDREFHELFKTHQTFILSSIFKASRSLQTRFTKPDMLSCGSCNVCPLYFPLTWSACHNIIIRTGKISVQKGDHTYEHYILFAEQLTRTFEVLVVSVANHIWSLIWFISLKLDPARYSGTLCCPLLSCLQIVESLNLARYFAQKSLEILFSLTIIISPILDGFSSPTMSTLLNSFKSSCGRQEHLKGMREIM